MKNKNNQPHDILHSSDQDRIIENYGGISQSSNSGGFLITTFFFVISTWAIIFLMFDKIYPFVSGAIELGNLPYYIGLLGAWILYTVTYSYFFMKKLHSLAIGKSSSVGQGLIIQAFVYLVMASGIALKVYRSSEDLSMSSLTSLRIPLVDNPVNILLLTSFLFALGFLISFINMGIKSKSKLESSDKLMFIIAAISIYAFTLIYNLISYGMLSEIFLTSAMFTSVIMMGVTPYVYSGAIYNGAKASKILNRSHYSAIFGITFFVLLVASYRMSSDLFILMNQHDGINFFNYSLIFVFAILSTAFTRVLTYPRLINEYNNDVMQTRRINDSNKGLMEDNDYIPMDDDSDDVDSISIDGYEDDHEGYDSSSQKPTQNNDDNDLYEEDHSTFDDEDADGLFDEDDDGGDDGLFDDDEDDSDDGLFDEDEDKDEDDSLKY